MLLKLELFVEKKSVPTPVHSLKGHFSFEKLAGEVGDDRENNVNMIGDDHIRVVMEHSLQLSVWYPYVDFFGGSNSLAVIVI